MARRTAIILGPVTQLSFFIMAVRLRPPIEEFYLWLLVLTAIQVFFHWMATGEKAIDFEQLDLKKRPLWKPVLGGIAFGLVPIAILSIGASPQPITDVWNEVATQAFFVGFVETLYLIATVRTVIHGRWVWVLGVFPLAHEYVRNALVAGDAAGFLASYAYTAGFGFYFLWLFESGSRGSERRREWFGAINCWVAHVVVNLGILAVQILLLGFLLLPV